MTFLAIAPEHNTPGINKRTGRPWRDGDEFQREARAFAKLHAGKVMTFNNLRPTGARFVEVIDYLTPMRGVDVIAFFCHGLKHAIQIGANLGNVETLAATLRACGATIVPLYACDAARDADGRKDDDRVDGPAGAGGFASVLARGGFRVDAHVTTAHTTINPFVRRFDPHDDTDDGHWLVGPGSTWWPTWRRALANDRDFRLSFPLWSEERLIAELASRAGAR